MSNPRTVMVVPTVRRESIEKFIRLWSGCRWDELIVVEDNASRSSLSLGERTHHFCWTDIEAELGDRAWIISRRDSAIRAFGLLKAAQMGAQYILSLDDDCYPRSAHEAERFALRHIANLLNPPRWASSVPGLRVRGLPRHPFDDASEKYPVLLSMGLWSNVPDLDAQTTLSEGMPENFQPPEEVRFFPAPQYVPFCGMNFAFDVRALPAMYFPRMGVGSPYARFDDIWAGLIWQKCFAQCGLFATLGAPIVRHDRASDPLANLRKEAPGMAAHERVWRLVDAAPLTARTLAGCVAELADHLAAQSDSYLSEWGSALHIWVELTSPIAADWSANCSTPVAA